MCSIVSNGGFLFLNRVFTTQYNKPEKISSHQILQSERAICNNNVKFKELLNSIIHLQTYSKTMLNKSNQIKFGLVMRCISTKITSIDFQNITSQKDFMAQFALKFDDPKELKAILLILNQVIKSIPATSAGQDFRLVLKNLQNLVQGVQNIKNGVSVEDVILSVNDKIKIAEKSIKISLFNKFIKIIEKSALAGIVGVLLAAVISLSVGISFLLATIASVCSIGVVPFAFLVVLVVVGFSFLIYDHYVTEKAFDYLLQKSNNDKSPIFLDSFISWLKTDFDNPILSLDAQNDRLNILKNNISQENYNNLLDQFVQSLPI